MVDIHRYLFTCDDWLATDQGDGQTSRLLRVSQLADINQGAMLRNNINRKIFDEHIWLSVGIRKTKSNFTRLQRLAVCMALLFITMIANAMWYKTKEDSDATRAITIGPISFTIHQLYTSLMSSLIVVPPMLIITIFFQKSKPRIEKANKYALSTYANTDERNSPAPKKRKEFIK